MNQAIRKCAAGALVLGAALGLGPVAGFAQVPVDDDGNAIGDYAPAATGSGEKVGNDGIPLRSEKELQILVGPIALYPDDLLAVVLPATTYPLQVVQAARFREELEDNPALEPDAEWDDSIVALVNYPEVLELLNEDLDWTWELGEAVVAQQADVIEAIADFRERAYEAGNLKSDEHQTVTRNEEVIEIAPVSEEVIYVPYYEPARVVVYQPRPAYYYYPRAYPVYYYPYPYGYSFASGYFWGVTTAFTIGWTHYRLGVYHQSYYGHPYYGHHYWDTWWYRRPSIQVYNNVYVSNNYNGRGSVNRYYDGDTWRPAGHTRLRYGDQRITRNRYYPNPATATSTAATRQQNAVSRDARSINRSAAGADVRLNRSAASRRDENSVRQMRQAISSNNRIRAAADDKRGDSHVPGATQHRDGASVREMRNALTASENRRTATTRPPSQARSTDPSSRSEIPQRRENIVQPRQSLQRSTAPAVRSTPNRTTRSPAPSYRAPQSAPARAPAVSSSPPARAVQRPAPSRSNSPSVSPRSSGNDARSGRTATRSRTR